MFPTFDLRRRKARAIRKASELDLLQQSSKSNCRKSDDIFKVLLTEQERSGCLTPASCYLAKFNVAETQDLLVSSISHWLLSGLEFKPPLNPVKGVIEEVYVSRDCDRVFVLLPHQQTVEDETCNQDGGGSVTFDEDQDGDCREKKVNGEASDSEQLVKTRNNTKRISARDVHQIVRDLVVGLYVFNQIPGLILTTRFDQSTTCRLATSYQDTIIGRHLVTVDYAMKCLWHGAYFDREHRMLFSESWRERLNVNSKGKPETTRKIIDDFFLAGMQDVSSLQGYQQVYDSMDLKYNQNEDPSDVSLEISFYLDQYHQHGSTWLPVPSFAVVGVVHEVDDKSIRDETKDRLGLIADLIQENLIKNKDICESVNVLSTVAGLLPLLVAFKKQQKIPNIAYLKAPISRKNTQTERELPPLMVNSDFHNQTFSEKNMFFGLNGGIQFDVETPTLTPLAEDIVQELRKSLLIFTGGDDKQAAANSSSLDNDESTNDAPLPTILVGNREYDVLELRLETFVAKACQKPIWANQLYTELTYLKFKSLPLTSSQLKEQFSRYFEDTDVSIEKSLRMAASMGLTAAFHGLLRDCRAGELEGQCEQGWSLMHEAAKTNSVHILAQLIQMALNVNTRQSMYRFDPGRTPLHLASRSGALQSVSCLLHCNAEVDARDERGWAAVHHAAFNNQMPVLRLILSKHDHAELPTNDRLKQTPLLLCAISGSLSALKWLIQGGVKVDVADADNRSIVHLATLHTRIAVLKYLIVNQSDNVQIWTTLSDMLISSNKKWQTAANRCIRILSDSKDLHANIIMAGLQATLVQLMKKSGESELSDTVATLCNISGHVEVQQVLADQQAIGILVQLLDSDDILTTEQAAIVLGNLAVDNETKELIGQEGGIIGLSKLLQSDNPALVSSALTAFNITCSDHRENQDRSSDVAIINNIVKQLSFDDESIQRNACTTLVTLAKNHVTNQDLIMDTGVIEDLRRMICTRNVVAQMKAAEVLQVLAIDNARNQNKMMEANLMEPTIELLKVLDLDLKEMASQAICAMSGRGTTQRRQVALLLGTNSLINLIMTKSELLACNCCPLVTALVYEDIEAQTTFMLEGGLTPLVSLLQPGNPTKLLAAVLRTIASLCVGISYTGNKKIQKELARQNILTLLLTIIETHVDNMTLQTEATHTCACAVLHNKDSFRILNDLNFDPGIFCKPIADGEKEVRLLAGMALALYACNRDTNWSKLRRKVSLTMDAFSHFLHSRNESQKCYAAFQVAVLGPLFQLEDCASCMVLGIEMLAKKLSSDNEDVFILAASLIGSLVYGRAGVSEALVLLHVVELLFDRMLTGAISVRSKCASILARLSVHRVARRKMMAVCRRAPEMYDCLVANLPKGSKLCEDFVKEFITARSKGLPSEMLNMVSVAKGSGKPK